MQTSGTFPALSDNKAKHLVQPKSGKPSKVGKVMREFRKSNSGQADSAKQAMQDAQPGASRGPGLVGGVSTGKRLPPSYRLRKAMSRIKANRKG